MATVLSDLITNKDAVPVVRDSAFQDGGYLRSSAALLTVAANIPANDIVHACRVPIAARVHSVKTASAVASTALAYNVGIYTDDGDATYTVKDADFFASAFDATGASLNGVEHIGESAVNTATLQTQPLWEALGYASEAAARAVTGEYFIVSLTISTTGNGGPTTIACKVDYVL